MQVPGKTSGGPTLANALGQVWMAWKGQDSDTRIFLSVLAFDGTTGPAIPVPQVGTSASPALTALGANLMLAWKGEQDHTIYWSQSSNTTGLSSPDPRWNPPGGSPVPDALSTDTPGLATFPSQPEIENPMSSGGYTVVAWKGQQEGSDRIYSAVYNLPNEGAWTALPVPAEFRTVVGPAVGIDNQGNISLYWTGSDNAIWIAALPYTWTEGSSSVIDLWSSQTRIPVIETTGRPAVASPQGVNAADTLFLLAWKGISSELWVGPP